MADNKTITFSASESVSANGKGRWYLCDNFTFSKINAVASSIPDYSHINSCNLACSVKKTTSIGSSSSGGVEIEFSTRSSQAQVSEVSGQVGSELLQTTLKNNTTGNYSVNLLPYIKSQTSDAGYISYSNATNICFYATYQYTFKLTWEASATITWNYNEPRAIVTVNGGTGGGTYHWGSTYTITATPPSGKRFVRWEDDANAPATRTFTVDSSLINAYETHKTYTAVFEELTYTVRWYNEDGSVLLETDSEVPYGDPPSYNGATPTKQGNAQHSYEFIGWNINTTSQGTTDLTAVVDNIEYYARFREIVNTYTVTWKNDDGTTLETDTLVPYGTPPDYNGDTPQKASTAQYHYTFLGWSADVNDEPLEDTELENVTGNIVYTAVYLPVLRKYKVEVWSFDENEGTLEGVVSGDYEYGTQLEITATAKHGYKIDALRIGRPDDSADEGDMSLYYADYTDNGDYDEDYTEGSITLSIPVFGSFSVKPFFSEVPIPKGTVYLQVNDKEEFLKHITVTTSDGSVLDLGDDTEDVYGENILDVGTKISLVAEKGYSVYVRVLTENYYGVECLTNKPGVYLVPGDYDINSAIFTVEREGVSQLYLTFDIYRFNGIYADGRPYWFGSVDESTPQHIYADGTKVYGYWEETDDTQ